MTPKQIDTFCSKLPAATRTMFAPRVTFTSPSVTRTETPLRPSKSTWNFVPTSSISVSAARTSSVRCGSWTTAKSIAPVIKMVR